MFGLTKAEEKIMRKLNTPIKIQDFLDTLPTNNEKKGETTMSPRRVLREKKAHCLEGAMLAAIALWLAGQKPLLMHFHTTPEDQDHAVTLYRTNGYWGAISKTNHTHLRFRDPVYKTLRELALSYFNEYFMFETGKKTLLSYTKPFDLSKLGDAWVTTEEELFDMVDRIEALPHLPLVPAKNKKHVRKADRIEIRAGKLTDWKKTDRRT